MVQRFGALVDETGRFVWCCMDTYGGGVARSAEVSEVDGCWIDVGTQDFVLSLWFYLNLKYVLSHLWPLLYTFVSFFV